MRLNRIRTNRFFGEGKYQAGSVKLRGKQDTAEEGAQDNLTIVSGVICLSVVFCP